jgi:flavin reductase (DIM6/NTAB) family NADH-FMN oxidoreductase RutF
MKQSIGAKTIVFPTPVFLVGSYDEQDRPNLMTVAWGGICCSIPPCVAISVREATYTYSNIMKTQAFTVGIPSAEQARVADYVGLFSGRDVDKFAAANLTAVRSELVHAPYAEDFPMSLECRVIQTVKIGLHTQFIGEILDVKCEETMLGEQGFPDIEKIKPMLFAPSNQAYYGTGEFLGQAFSIGRWE